MDNEFLHYKGVYGEQKLPFWDTAVYIEPVKQRSEVYNFEINEHLHSDLIQIFVLEEGGGIITSEGTNISLEVPCIVFIPPTVLHGFSWHSNIKGSVISISASYFDECLKNTESISHHFQSFQVYAFEKELDKFQNVISDFKELSSELSSHLPDKRKMMSLMIAKFLLKLYRKGRDGNQESVQSDSKVVNYFYGFLKEIANDKSRSKTIKEYASSLNITPVHLNRVCQTVVKKSALQIIHEKLIVEAKNKLLYTHFTIREVAYDLNFKDPSYFCKFFKKQVGQGPKEFRKSMQKNQIVSVA